VSERLTVGVAARLSRYLQVLTQAKKMGRSSISSQDVSEYTHINATQIRRDLSAFGKFGKRGVGYNIVALLAEIRGILRKSGQHYIALIGAGRLGQAIAGSSIFADHGFHIVTIFDDDPAKIGTELAGVAIRSTADLSAHVIEHNIIAAVIAVPAGAAQTVADQLVQAGVHIIFHDSEALLQTAGDVVVHSSCPAGELLHAL
jgi:redox-sensing transcriptional repressor